MCVSAITARLCPGSAALHNSRIPKVLIYVSTLDRIFFAKTQNNAWEALDPSNEVIHMLKEKDVDKMLELCFNAVERMASYLEDQSDTFDEIETDDNKIPINKIFHTLGASIGNFLYTYRSVMEAPGLIEAFTQGLHDYLKFCQHEDAGSTNKRPTQLIDWVVDNDAYKN